MAISLDEHEHVSAPHGRRRLSRSARAQRAADQAQDGDRARRLERRRQAQAAAPSEPVAARLPGPPIGMVLKPPSGGWRVDASAPSRAVREALKRQAAERARQAAG